MAESNFHIDPELLVRISKGDELAFRSLYDQFHRPVFNQAYHYLRSSELASDATQEVFIKIWMIRQKLPEVKDIKSFLFIIARNLIISNLRKKVLHGYLEEELQLLEADTVLPDKQLSLKESMAILREAIENLTPQQKKVYTLSRTHGFNYEEIAKQLSLSPETVKTHMKQALKSIRKYLLDHSVDLVLLILFVFENRWPQ